MKIKYIYLILIVILGILLRFERLGDRSFWFDEIYELQQIEHLDNLVSGGPGDRIITKGYYFILNILKDFGFNEFTARLPAAIFGILTIFLIYFLGKHLFDDKTAILSAFLLSVSTYHIAYSQEARPYSMLCFFSILTFYLFCRLLRQGDIIWWFLFFIATVISIYTHLAAAYVLGAEIIFGILWVSINYEKYKKLLVRNSIKLLVFFVLALITFRHVIVKGINHILKPELFNRHIDDLYFRMKFFHKIFIEYFCSSMTYGYEDLILILYLAVLVFGLVISVRKYRMAVFGISIFIIIPFIMLFSFFKPFHFFNPRYFIFMLPVIIVGCSRGIVSLCEFISKKQKVNNVLFLIFFIIIGVIQINPLARYHYSEKDNWRDISAYLSDKITQGDRIILNNHNDYACLYHYLSDEAMHIIAEGSDENNIWYVKYVNYGIHDLYNEKKVLDMKNFDNYITVFKLKKEKYLEPEDINAINYRLESEKEHGKIGFWIRDKEASGRKARFARKGEAGWLLFGPHIVLPEGKYIAKFCLKTSSNRIENEIAVLNIYNGGDVLKTPYLNLKGTDFKAHKQYQHFCLEFDQNNDDRQEFRVLSKGTVDLWIDYVEISRVSKEK